MIPNSQRLISEGKTPGSRDERNSVLRPQKPMAPGGRSAEGESGRGWGGAQVSQLCVLLFKYFREETHVYNLKC